MLKKIFAAIIMCICLVCSLSISFAENKLSIVCTSFPCYDFVRAVAGEHANIQLLIKPGAEVHSFEPTPAHVMAIADCDLFVYVGGESDAWVLDILESFGKEAPQTLRFFDCVEAIETEHEHDHDDHVYDEHIWTLPRNASIMISALENALCSIDEEYSAEYSANAHAYQAEIAKIDEEITGVLNQAARREMIFADRFPFLYFADAYDIEWYAAFESCSSESEPSAKTIAQLIDRIIRDDIPVVYKLELSSGKTAQTIMEETGAKVLVFHSIQNVSEDEFAAGESYVSLMRKNIEALKEGLN